MGSITRITRMSGRSLIKHVRSYFVDRPPSRQRKGDRSW